jgi:hypothetical protein
MSPRRFGRRLLNISIIVGSLVWLAWLVDSEHQELGQAIGGLGHARAGLIFAAYACERVSIVSLGRMQRRLLRAGNHRLTLSSALTGAGCRRNPRAARRPAPEPDRLGGGGRPGIPELAGRRRMPHALAARRRAAHPVPADPAGVVGWSGGRQPGPHPRRGRHRRGGAGSGADRGRRAGRRLDGRGAYLPADQPVARAAGRLDRVHRAAIPPVTASAATLGGRDPADQFRQRRAALHQGGAGIVGPGDAGLQGLDDGLEQRVLPREVVIERAAAHPGGREDRLEGSVVPLLGPHPALPIRASPGSIRVCPSTGRVLPPRLARRDLHAGTGISGRRRRRIPRQETGNRSTSRPPRSARE